MAVSIKGCGGLMAVCASLSGCAWLLLWVWFQVWSCLRMWSRLYAYAVSGVGGRWLCVCRLVRFAVGEIAK